LQEQVGDDVGPVAWRSFLLRPTPEFRDLEQFRAYTQRWARPAEMEPACDFHPWAGDTVPPSHSVPPAVAARVARHFGDDAARRYHDALFHAYFTENRTVSDRTVLVTIAGEIGLDRDAFDAALTAHGEDEQRVVFADHHAAVDVGIHAVPAVVVDGRYLVQGAVEVDDYLRVIERARAEK
jgi:predicted DsbA family dithiol-disulfide isomerase